MTNVAAGEPRLVCWTHCAEDISSSEEFRYLRAFLERQIALGAPGRTRVDDRADTEWRGGDVVLRLSSDRTFFTAATLAAMLAALTEAEVVLATPLAVAAGARAGAIFTLTGFEEVEVDGLAAVPAASIVGPQPCPALSLWRAATFRAADAGRVDALVPNGARVARCGVFHEFIDYFGEVRADALPFIPPDSGDVLEVGCARGRTGALIQKTLGCRVTGVELNPVVAAEARERLHAVHCGDIETLDLGGPFDAIVALELFEHLRDPMGFVARMLRLLRPGGRLIMSTPNVGHYAIVRDLIAGRWDYLPIGILCSTHLRFFTRRTLEDWLAMAGSSRFEIVPQTTQLPDDVAAWARSVPGADLASLATKGFWVLAQP